MSKITNDGLRQSGTLPTWQKVAIVGVKGLIAIAGVTSVGLYSVPRQILEVWRSTIRVMFYYFELSHHN